MSCVLGKEFSDLIQGNKYEIGHMEAGHGMNGKKRLIETSNDLTTMWSEFKGKRCFAVDQMSKVKCDEEISTNIL